MSTSGSSRHGAVRDRVGTVMVLAALLVALVGAEQARSAPPAAALNAPMVGIAVQPHASTPGYWLVGSDGGVFAHGGVQFWGSHGGSPLNKPIVGLVPTPTGGGYWLAASDGGVFTYGDAGFFGSMGGTPLNAPVVGLGARPTSLGYWLVASDGGVFTFGDAPFYGSMGGQHLNHPIVGMAPTPSGLGYWLVASDGGIFSFGDAQFHGSTGDLALSKPIVGMAATPSGGGYWLVGADGGIFSFGDARFHGSMGSTPLNAPVVSLTSTPSGAGYWMVAADGGVFAFGDAPFLGSNVDGTIRGPANQPATSAARDRIVAAARSYLGYGGAQGRTQPLRDCPGARMSGGSSKVGPWCACFASKIWNGAGAEWTQTASSQNFKAQAQSRHRWRGTARPSVGDVAVWQTNAKPSTGHVSIVVWVDPDYDRTGLVKTIGGNQSGAVTEWGPMKPAGSMKGKTFLGYASPVPLTSSTSGAMVDDPADEAQTNADDTRYAYVDQRPDSDFSPDDPADVPDPPTATHATAGAGRARLTWNAPPTTGADAISGYVVVPYRAGVAQTPITVPGTITSTTVTGLANGASYTFTVAATNGVGTGQESDPSGAVTPVAYAPFVSWSAYVQRTHADVAGRAPTRGELTDWTGRLGAGSAARGDLPVALRRSADATGNVDPVTRLYSAYFLRTPDAGGLGYWIGQRRGGRSLVAVSDYFSRSTEFRTRYGQLTHRQFVERIYLNVLGRPGERSGIDYWTSELEGGRRTRGSVMIGFSESAEYKRSTAELTDVAVAYITLLGRSPSPTEVSGWADRQRSGVRLVTLVTELLDGAEYATRIAG